MGCDWSCNPAGLPGPVREPVPAEPEVVGVDTERHLPANKSIYVGEYARFLLVFDPVEFICNENDFTTSDDDVTVTMEEGADNVVRISVGETVGAGSVVEIRFRGQLFMNVTAVANVRIDGAFGTAGIPTPVPITNGYTVGFVGFDDESYIASTDEFRATNGATVIVDEIEEGSAMVVLESDLPVGSSFEVYFRSQLFAIGKIVSETTAIHVSKSFLEHEGDWATTNMPEQISGNLEGAYIRIDTNDGNIWLGPGVKDEVYDSYDFPNPDFTEVLTVYLETQGIYTALSIVRSIAKDENRIALQTILTSTLEAGFTIN